MPLAKPGVRFKARPGLDQTALATGLISHLLTRLEPSGAVMNFDLRGRADSLLSAQVFRYDQVLMYGFAFIAALLLAIFVVPIIICSVLPFDYCPVTWPITVFDPRLPRMPDLGTDTLVAVAVLLLFCVAVLFLARHRFRLHYVVVVGVALVLGTNLIQGLDRGYSDPISGGDNQYFHDAILISDASDYLRNFEERQPDLLMHTRTHPPGPALTVYGLLKLLDRPGLVSIFIALVSVSLSLVFFNGIMKRELASPTADFTTFLFVLIPAIQIYYLASIEALIAAFLLGALFFFRHPQPIVSVAGTIAFLSFASFLTFGFLFILPVLVGFELIREKRLTKSFLVLAGVAALYFVIHIATDFSYLRSFFTASDLENPDGFKLIAVPASYLFTRLEGLFVIFAFFGPFLILLFIRGIDLRGVIARALDPRGIPAVVKQLSPLSLLAVLGVLTLLAMFATGAYGSGETARVTSYIYPYLMFPVAKYLSRFNLQFRDQVQLSGLVFTQTVAMQLFGTYLW